MPDTSILGAEQKTRRPGPGPASDLTRGKRGTSEIDGGFAASRPRWSNRQSLSSCFGDGFDALVARMGASTRTRTNPVSMPYSGGPGREIPEVISRAVAAAEDGGRRARAAGGASSPPRGPALRSDEGCHGAVRRPRDGSTARRPPGRPGPRRLRRRGPIRHCAIVHPASRGGPAASRPSVPGSSSARPTPRADRSRRYRPAAQQIVRTTASRRRVGRAHRLPRAVCLPARAGDFGGPQCGR